MMLPPEAEALLAKHDHVETDTMSTREFGDAIRAIVAAARRDAVAEWLTVERVADLPEEFWPADDDHAFCDEDSGGNHRFDRGLWAAALRAALLGGSDE